MDYKFSARMNGYGSDFIKEMFAAARNPDLISFAGGAPAPEVYPVEDFRAASDRAFAEMGETMLAYDGAEGILPLREQIANERMKSMGVDVTSDDIRVLSGSQQGIDYIARMFIDEGDKIIVEDPTYLGALNAFDFYKPTYVTVPIDDHGMRMDELEKTMQQHPDAKILYTVPDYQNPAGISLAESRRKEMVDLAVKHNVLIVEDSPYYEVRFTDNPIPPIKAFDTTGHVVYLGSFSKIISPGIRLGWVSAEQELLDKFRVQKEATDFQAGTVAQWQASVLMRDIDMQKHLNHVRSVYKKRRDTALRMIEDTFPDTVQYTRPEGGFFIWLTIPGIDTTALFPRAVNEFGVAYVPGESFYANEKRKDNIRISYSQMTEEKIIAGMPRLVECLMNC